jgi:hypothetical protein
MPILSIEITCLKTRCEGCYHCHYGKERRLVPDITCSLFGRALQAPGGSPLRLKQCVAAEARAHLTETARKALAMCGVV